MSLILPETAVDRSIHPETKTAHNAPSGNIIIGAAVLIVGVAGILLSLRSDPHIGRATAEVTQITTKIAAMYATASIVDSGADMAFAPAPAPQSGGGLLYIQAGAFPEAMLEANNIARNPWGGSATIRAASVIAPDDGYVIEMTGLPRADCAAFLKAVAGDRRNPLLAAVDVANGNADLTALPHRLAVPVNDAAARSACDGADNPIGEASGSHAVALLYRLKD
jgi:hypothetical protein